MDQPAEPASTPASTRPLVARPLSSRGLWGFVIAIGLGASVLFAALETRRTAHLDSALAPTQVPGDSPIEAPAPLVIPEPRAEAATPFVFAAPTVPAAVSAPPPLAPGRPARTPAALYNPAPAAPYYLPPTSPPGPSTPALVYQAPPSPSAAAPEPSSKGELRVSAGHLAC